MNTFPDIAATGDVPFEVVMVTTLRPVAAVPEIVNNAVACVPCEFTTILEVVILLSLFPSRRNPIDVAPVNPLPVSVTARLADPTAPLLGVIPLIMGVKETETCGASKGPVTELLP